MHELREAWKAIGAAVAVAAICAPISAFFLGDVERSVETRPRQERAAAAGVVAGVVRNARGAPVAEALVVLCDRASGLPIGVEKRRHFLHQPESAGSPTIDSWWFARTGADGAFRFDGVLPGEYRLVAQSWPDVERPAGPQEENGLTVRLRGVAESVTVPSEEAAAQTITPLGDGSFVYHRGASNDDWYLFLSRSAPAADPVLGFLGWKGAFLANAVGCIRMPGGHAIVRGLPETQVHYTVFANDSRPGFGAGSFHARAREVVAHDTNLVVGWSDGIHDPPARLEPLCAEVRAMMEDGGYDAVEELLARGREEAWASRPEGKGFERLFAAAEILGPLDRELELPSGRKATVADVMAAAAYNQLRR